MKTDQDIEALNPLYTYENKVQVRLSRITQMKKNVMRGLLVQGGGVQTQEVFFGVFLIKHPNHGYILFESGFGKSTFQNYDSLSSSQKGLLNVTDISNLSTKLSEHGVNANQIQYIILSHLHWDHTGSIAEFPNAKIITTATEYDWAISLKNTPTIQVFKNEIKQQSLKWRFIKFSNKPFATFEKSLDLFKDGSLILVPLPGHTPGQMGLFAKLESGRNVFFIGDSSWLKDGVEFTKRKPYVLNRFFKTDHSIFNSDVTILRIHKLMNADPNLFVVPSHDYEASSWMEDFPKYTF